MADMLYGLEGLGLTPQEINKVIYHRKNMENPFITKEGNPMTIFSTGIQIPEGKYKGQFVSVPGYLGDGKVVTNDDELWKYWKKDINAGKWPLYPDSEQLNARDQYVHQVMDKDVAAWMQAQQNKQPYQQMDSLFYSDPLGFSIK